MSSILLALIMIIINMKTLQMLQQQHYDNNKYLEWLKRFIKNSRHLLLLIFLIYLILLVPNNIRYQCYALYMMIIFYLLDMKIRNQKNRIPLKMTWRMKRLTLVVLILGIIILYLIDIQVLNTQIFLFPYTIIISYLLAIIANWLVNPIETIIKERYKKQCRQKIIESKVKCIGIGGSYGKTSIKNYLYQLLRDDYYTLMTPKSYNNAMGISKCVLSQLENQHELFIVELGVDHCGEMDDLMNLVKLDVSVISAIGNQHLSSFKSLEAIEKEKLKLYDNLEKGICVVNGDQVNINHIKLKPSVELISYGCEDNNDYQINNIYYDDSGCSFDLIYQDECYHIESKLLGKHSIYNLCAAIIVARLYNIDMKVIINKIKYIKSVDHRLEKKRVKDYWVLDDAYNANVVGARNACDVLKVMNTKRIIMSGGLVELSNQESKENKALGAYMAKCCDEVILVGERRSIALKQGLLSEGFNVDNIHVVRDIDEGFEVFNRIKAKDCYLLVENDLPDVYHC